MKIEQSLWVEKYRPRKFEDLILGEDYSETIKKYLDKKEIPNLLLSGPPGGGKCLAGEEIIEVWVEVED
jgi:DNA polymerase III delta prime subunit